MDYFLSISASDNSGGAGIQQDIKVSQLLGYWPLTAITGITVQNFNKVFEIHAVGPELLKSQIEVCIDSFNIKAIKIGALCSKENIIIVAKLLKKNKNKNIVLDPVLFSTDGKSFLEHSETNLMIKELFPLTKIITPNKNEFEILANKKADTIEECLETARQKCKNWNTSILLKGGHFNSPHIREAIITKTNVEIYERERKNFVYTHGTGCTLSTALACFMGNYANLTEAYHKATEFTVKYYEKFQQVF